MTVQQIQTPSAARRTDAVSQSTQVEQARAVAEVAAAVRVAQDFPRNLDRAVEQMRQSCSMPALADRAFYSLPRAGGRIEGATVHLARELARCYQNVDYGIRELRRDDEAGESEMQAWAWDQENNVRSLRSFIVPHARMSGRGSEKRREALIDLADIANNNSSVAARAVRETIFTVLPTWFVEDAKDLAMRTLNGGGEDKPLADQITEAIDYFAGRGISKVQLETRLDRPSQQWTAQDLGVLRVVDSEISRGEKRVEDEFPAPANGGRVTADEIAASKTEAKQERPEPEPEPEVDPATADDPTVQPEWGEEQS